MQLLQWCILHIIQCDNQLCTTSINCAMLQSIVQYCNQLCNNTTTNCAIILQSIVQHYNQLCNGAGGWVIIRVWPFPALGTGDKALRRQVFIHISIHT